jgi:transposase
MLGKGVVIVTYDQARFTLDADVRRCWAKKGATPLVYRNGSKKGINVGGAYSSTGYFHSYCMPHQVKEEVLWNIKLLRMKFPKMLLLLDKATWNKNKTVIPYLKRNQIPYLFFPTGASDLNPVEECWRQTRENVTANRSYNTEEALHNHLQEYWKKQPFKHNVLNYLL